MTTKRKHTERHRRLALVDLENLAGAPPCELSAREIENLAVETRHFLEVDGHDQVVVACNPHWASAVRSSWPDCVLRVRGGHNGADLELRAAAKERTLRRFGALWILSGDGGFESTALRARGLGLRVVVVARPTSLAKRLGQQASRIVRFSWSQGEVDNRSWRIAA